MRRFRVNVKAPYPYDRGFLWIREEWRGFYCVPFDAVARERFDLERTQLISVVCSHLPESAALLFRYP